MRASPFAIRSRSSRRSASVSPECRIASPSPKRAAKRPAACGVSAISGTSTIAPSPRSSAAAHAWRYTSVLPLPVAPASRKFPPLPNAPTMRSIAARCSSVSCSGSASPASPSRDSGAGRSPRRLRTRGATSASVRAGVEP